MGQDLFNNWYVTITFGKYNTWGTSKTSYLNTLEEACRFIDTKLKRRLSSPKRIGCAYKIVSFDGSEEILETINHKIIDRFSWFENRGTNRNSSTP